MLGRSAWMVWATWLLCPLMGCDAGGHDGSGIQVDTMDTGRVTVRNPAAGLWDQGSGWSLERIIRIGSVDGPSPYAFGRLRDVALGPDGHVYVLDSQAREVRVFGIDGEYIRTIGGSGRGPGELASPYSLSFDGEGRLWVADESNRRYTVFAPEGDALSVHSSPIQGGMASGQVRLTPDGGVLDVAFLPGHGLSALAIEFPDGAVVRDTLVLGNWTPPGFVRVAGSERLVRPAPISPRQVQELDSARRLWIGNGAEYALHHVAFTGDTLLSIFRAGPPVPLTPDDVDSQLAYAAEATADGYAGELSDLPMHYPFFTRIVASEDGSLWVYREGGGSRVFDVFDDEGRYLGEVSTTLAAGPLGVHPHITASHVVGVTTDALGVEFVEVFQIVRPGDTDAVGPR